MKTIITPLALVGLLAVPLIASLPQDQGATGQPPPNEGEYDWRERWPGRRVSQVDQRKLTRGLQGLWRLSEIDVPGRFAPTQAEKGYLLVSGNHMSMEIHGDWYTEDSYDPSVRGESTRRITGGLTQTGIHTFEINEWGRLVTRTLIGTKSTFDGTYEFEPPRTERTYEIDVSGSKAILRGDDGRSLFGTADRCLLRIRLETTGFGF